VVVELRVVVLDAFEEEVARLLQEGVDSEVERVVVGEEGRFGSVGVLLKSGEVGREGELLFGGVRGELVEEGGEEVGVVDGDGNLDEDVVVSEAALLQAVIVSSDSRARKSAFILVGGEFGLLVRRDEGG
jgi:hypothetical protein